MSHVDFHTAIKMDQHSSSCSDFSTLTPLPTYTWSTAESYSYPVFHDHADISDCISASETNKRLSEGRLTPQTPELVVYHDPPAVCGVTNEWTTPESWSNDPFGSIELELSTDTTTILPTEFWPNPYNAHIASATQSLWNQIALAASSPPISHELVSNTGAVPSLSTSECSTKDLNSTDVLHQGWIDCRTILTRPGLVDMIAQAPFIHDLSPSSSTPTMWGNGYMHQTVLY